MRPFPRTVALVAIAVIAALLGPAAPQAQGATAAKRVMVYGDSITQGSSGDWTWRCRLWRRLGGASQVDFVGPRNDLWAWRTGRFGSTAYADPGCDRDHAALWGVTFTEPKFDLSQMALASRADVVVAMIGQNDLLGGATPASLEAKWRTEIAQIRASRPGTDFVFVQDPDVWLTGTIPEFNADLVSLAGSLSTSTSRVVATANPDFDEFRDTIDDMHPSANGEIRIAAVVANALRTIGIGPGWPVPATAIAPGPAFAPTPRLTATGKGFTTSWALTDYADAERVWWRDTTVGGAWRVSGALTGSSLKVAGTPGHSYAVRLQPRKGHHFSGTLSAVGQVRVPARPAAVSRLAVRKARGCRGVVSWKAARFATSYRVTVRRAGQSRTVVARTVTTTSLTTPRLRHRAGYGVSVRSFGPLLGATTAVLPFRGC